MDSGEAAGAAGAATIGGLVVAGVVWGVRSVNKWRNDRQHLSVAVLGEVGVGKTSLLNLWAGISAGNSKPTTIPRKYQAIMVDVDGRKFLLREGYDVSGSKDAWDDWRRSVKDGYVVYLADARRLAAEAGLTPKEPPPNPLATPSRILRDVRQIALWRDEIEPKNWRCVLAVTHRDADPRFSSPGGEERYHRDISDQLRDAVHILGGRGQVAVTSGSLVPSDLGNRLKDDIIRLLIPEWT